MKPTHTNKYGNKAAKVSVSFYIERGDIECAIYYFHQTENRMPKKSEMKAAICDALRLYGFVGRPDIDDNELDAQCVELAKKYYPEFYQ